jgi:hypothetical protein
MRSSTSSDSVEVAPGESGMLSVAVTNTSSVIDAFRVQVFGLDPAWVTVTPERLSLFPGQTEHVDISMVLPDDYPASNRTIAVNVSSTDDPGAFSLNQVELEVQPRNVVSVRVDPVMITGGRSARFGLVISNIGNASVIATGYARDPEDLAVFEIEPPSVVVPPGHDQVIEITAGGGRSWFGQPRVRTFTFGVETTGTVETIGTFIQRPRIGRWMISLLGLLTAAAVFAAVLSRTFDSVVEEARVSTDVLDAALDRNEAGGAVVPTNPGGVAGILMSSTTGAGLSGAQAELFVADDLATAIASAATDDTGVFAFANLGAGEYKLRLTGSGVGEIWYGDTSNPADAAPIEVALGEVTDIGVITIAGIPVSITGVIDTGGATGVTVSLVPAGADPSTAPIVATAVVGPDGSFTLTDVPSPGNYQMIIETPGSAPQVRNIVLEPGRPLENIEVTIQPGSGLISGTVFGPAGALGGATVTATDGSTEVATVSLTESPVGTYSLRNLPTPGQYTVTVSRAGFASESRTVSLTNDATSASFDARLVPSVGSIRGRAVVDGVPSRGVKVTVNGGDVNRSAGVVSQGPDAGGYAFDGLEAPGTYTLTFTGAGMIPQVRVVDLDPANGTESATGIDVSLSRERTAVRGLIRNVDGSPVGQAEVSLSNGADKRTMLSADTPRGQFEFSNVAPGSYTLTASLRGTEPVVILVTVTAATPTAPIDIQLGAQAGLSGSVIGFDPTTRSLPVKLFLPSQFPNGDVLQTVATDAEGRYSFANLNAPADYVVAVYAGPAAADPLDSATIRTEPGAVSTVPPFVVQTS